MKWQIIIVLLALVASACGPDNNNPSDAGPDADTDTDTDSDTDTVDSCENTTYEWGSFPAELCFCPGDEIDPDAGDDFAYILSIDDIEHPLFGFTELFEEGTFSQCMIVTITTATFEDGNLTDPDDDPNGIQYDPDHPEDMIFSVEGVQFLAFPAADPYDSSSPSGYNETQPSKEVTIEVPGLFGTMRRWMPEEQTFEEVATTYIESWGIKYITTSFSAYAVTNKPFVSFEVSFPSGDTNGYDFNEDGVLVNLNAVDEGENFVNGIEFSVHDGDSYFDLIPTAVPNQYRLDDVGIGWTYILYFNVFDRNQDSYRHTETREKTVDLNVNLCDGIICGDNADCDPSDGLCYCDLGFEGDPDAGCTDIDACDPNPCFPTVDCTDDPAPSLGYECGDCPFGYTGDGEFCTPIADSITITLPLPPPCTDTPTNMCDDSTIYILPFTYTGPINVDGITGWCTITDAATPGAITNITYDGGVGSLEYHSSSDGVGAEETIHLEKAGPISTVPDTHTHWII